LAPRSLSPSCCWIGRSCKVSPDLTVTFFLRGVSLVAVSVLAGRPRDRCGRDVKLFADLQPGCIHARVRFLDRVTVTWKWLPIELDVSPLAIVYSVPPGARRSRCPSRARGFVRAGMAGCSAGGLVDSARPVAQESRDGVVLLLVLACSDFCAGFVPAAALQQQGQQPDACEWLGRRKPDFDPAFGLCFSAPGGSPVDLMCSVIHFFSLSRYFI